MFNPNKYSLEPMINNLSETFDSVLKINEPKVDVYYDESAITIAMDIPGITKDCLSINIINNEITIIGKYQKKDDDNTKYIYKQRIQKDFKRVLTLEMNFNANEATANIQDGVLFLNLPRTINKTQGITINID